jgi:hypothetical protein
MKLHLTQRSSNRRLSWPMMILSPVRRESGQGAGEKAGQVPPGQRESPSGRCFRSGQDASFPRILRRAPSHDASPVKGMIQHFVIGADVDDIQLSHVSSTGSFAAPVQPHIRAPFETAAP